MTDPSPRLRAIQERLEKLKRLGDGQDNDDIAWLLAELARLTQELEAAKATANTSRAKATD